MLEEKDKNWIEKNFKKKVQKFKRNQNSPVWHSFKNL